MSFTSDVKDELAAIELSDSSKRAQLSALFQLLASLSISNRGLSLNITCTNAKVIKRIAMDVRALYGLRCDIEATRQKNLDKRNIYTLIICEKAREILEDLDLWTGKGLQEHPRMGFLNHDEMVRSYLAGCFMAGGSINSPKSTSYHLEIAASSENQGQFVQRLLEKEGIPSRMTVRRKHHLVYMKSAETIADMLRLLGASEAVMQFEDERIQRDFINSLHRLDNVKIANEQKSLKVADEQIEAINYLKDRGLMRYLSEKDRQIAMVRYDNPDASLKELSAIYQQQSGVELTKSGIRHRFENIYKLVEKYRKREEEHDS
ncbi:MAG: DNA-binding protein WhiA [Erysipelotrichaceae bacterium]|nr:DNA-binding protein WhiA [Erysipelotrichaceae bacterium]